MKRRIIAFTAIILMTLLFTAELSVTQARLWEDWKSETFTMLSKGGYISKRTTGDARIKYGPLWVYPSVKYKNIPWLRCKELWCCWKATGGWWQSGKIYVSHSEACRYLSYVPSKLTVYMYNRGYNCRGTPYQAFWLEATDYTKRLLRQFGIDRLLATLYGIMNMVMAAATAESPAAAFITLSSIAAFCRTIKFHPWMIYTPLRVAKRGFGTRYYTIMGTFAGFMIDFGRYGAPNFFRPKWSCTFRGDTGVFWWKMSGDASFGMRIGIAADPPSSYGEVFGYANPIAVVRDIGIAYKDGEVKAGIVTGILLLGDGDIKVVRSDGYSEIIKIRLVNGTLLPDNTTYIGPNCTVVFLIGEMKVESQGLNSYAISLPAEVEAMINGMPIEVPRIVASDAAFIEYETGEGPLDVYYYDEEKTTIGYPGFNGTCATYIHLYGLEPVNVSGHKIIVAVPSTASLQSTSNMWLVAGVVLVAIAMVVAAGKATKHAIQDLKKNKFIRRKTQQ